LHAGSSLHNLLSRAAADAGTSLNWRIQVTSFDAACAMVAAGLGVSIMPRAATTAFIRSLSLAAIPLNESWARRDLFLCVRSSGNLNSAAQLLLDHLQTTL
jgi:DNA-binding transcriptional LysR family regulator